jgi:hypothetical protein
VQRADPFDPGSGRSFTHYLKIHDILPRAASAGYEDERGLNASIRGVRTPAPLRLRFINNLVAVPYEAEFHRYQVSMVAREVIVGGAIEYTLGWMHYIIQLGEFVPETTGGLIGDKVNGTKDWRYCKQVHDDLGEPILKYWNGVTWVLVPSLWQDPIQTKLIGFAVWKEVGYVKTQFGTRPWPDPVHEWSEGALSIKEGRLDGWQNAIQEFWTNKFELKREGCLSDAPECCRHPVKCAIHFVQTDVKRKGIVLAENYTRANSSAWSCEMSTKTAIHEYGHHLGNPDEYMGAATVDPTVNGDGAVAGIDEKSIMGKGKTIRRRHYNPIGRALTHLVSTHLHRVYTYIVVDCL